MKPFLDYLEKRKQDRGVMADLRCALIPAKRFRAYPYLARFGGIDSPNARVIQTIAGLYAHHPVTASTGNIGLLCSRMCSKEEDRTTGAMAKRFQYLLAASREEICERIIRIILRAKAERLAVNYQQLYTDLLYWNDRVKTRWAAAFWGPAKEVDDALSEQG